MLDFLKELVRYFYKRISSERYRESHWRQVIPEHAKVTDQQIERFIMIVREIAFLLIFRNDEDVDGIFHNLAWIRADLILPELLER